MNDYAFGQKILKLRTKLKLSQSELGDMLGVSNKAVSKWETGAAKPSIDVLATMANIFNMTIDELLSNEIEHNISMIVLTGGPCAGKTTAQSWIETEFTKKGYEVIFVKESATDLITSGISYNNLIDSFDFQKLIFKSQMFKEEQALSAAKRMKKQKVLIVCDRGLLDSKCYLSPAEFKRLLNEFHTNEVEIRDKYDAVFHLVSAAKGAVEFYTLENNKARTETPEQAAISDDKIIACYTGCPHFRVIDNSTDFRNKMIRLMQEISSLLGEPTPYEIERKYLIEMPDLEYLNGLKNCNKVDIVQTYLEVSKNQESRIRQRGENGNYIYTKTTKENVSSTTRVETEKRLTQDEYLELLTHADPNLKQINKTRYCLTYKNQYFEIDIFPFFKDKAILEIELSNENQDIKIPKFIKVIKEVTDDDNYKNHSLAKIA